MHRTHTAIVCTCAAFLCAFVHVWLLVRFYQPFIFQEPHGRIWAVADDVYISACYGRSLVSGQGFVWYPGAPKIEGISNPLWSALIGLLHALVGFTEDRLGLFMLAVNGLLFCLSAAIFWFLLSAVAKRSPKTSPLWYLILLPLSCLDISLSYWSAEGFEVALAVVLAFSMLGLCLKAVGKRADLAIAATFLAGMATRMDFIRAYTNLSTKPELKTISKAG